MHKGVYVIDNNKLTFNSDRVELDWGNFRVPDNVTVIDFANISIVRGTVDLLHLSKVVLRMNKVVFIDQLLLPPLSTVLAHNLYWINYINHLHSLAAPTYSRMKWLRPDRFTTQMVYLSGKVVGQLYKREIQRGILYDKGFAVYSPGNHITTGAEVANNTPEYVYKLDREAMERADVFVFDLGIMSAGTCAELGMAIALGYHKTKRLYYINYQDEGNFFINGLLRHLTPLTDIEELVW